MNTDILSNLVITKIHSASSLYTPLNGKAVRKNRERWAIILKYEGETIYTTNGKSFLSNLNHAIILPKGCSYQWLCTKPGHFFAIEFDSDTTYFEPLSFPIKNGELFLKMLQDLEFKRTMKKAITEMESIKDAYCLIIYLLQTISEPYFSGDKRKKLEPALQYVAQNYNKVITNDALAKITGTSTVYFRKLFSSVMGISPIMYARQIRIEKAKEILRSDYSSLSDVARSLGYVSLYDFSRDFKKHVGVPPSKY